MGKIDIITGTLGKALGGAMGGFTSGRKEVIETAAPEVASLPVLQHAGADDRRRLAGGAGPHQQVAPSCATACTRTPPTSASEIERIGFTIKPGTHPVVPVMLFDAPVAQKFAARMFELGVLLSGFFYPVVPMGQARVRVQLSAAHTREQLDKVLKAFEQAGRELGIIEATTMQVEQHGTHPHHRRQRPDRQ